MLHRLAPLLLALLLLAACGRAGPAPAAGTPGGPGAPAADPAAREQAERQAHLDAALHQLIAMNAAADQGDWAKVQQSVAAYKREWEALRPAVARYSPPLENILLSALQEMEGGLNHQPPQAWEFDEEATKVARLWGDLAPKLGLTADPALLPPPEKVSLPPFEQETSIQVVIRDYSFTPNRITVPKNTKVTLQLLNQGTQVHELVLDRFGEVENIPPGGSKEFVFVAEHSGTYEFACHLPGHYEAGMIGTLTVQG